MLKNRTQAWARAHTTPSTPRLVVAYGTYQLSTGSDTLVPWPTCGWGTQTSPGPCSTTNADSSANRSQGMEVWGTGTKADVCQGLGGERNAHQHSSTYRPNKFDFRSCLDGHCSSECVPRKASTRTHTHTYAHIRTHTHTQCRGKHDESLGHATNNARVGGNNLTG